MTASTDILNPVTPIQQGAVLSSSNPLPVSGSLTPYPIGGTVITGNATGTTGAVGAIAAEMFEPTPEMIAAGARTLELVWQEISDARPIVRSIYAAILAARE